MAGEAPKLYPEDRSWSDWFENASDWSLAFAMLALAIAIGVAIYLIDINVFG